MINYGSDKSLDVGSHWIATSYEKCNCRAHQEDPETINELVSEQYSYNCKVMEETQQLTKRLHERDQKVMHIEVELNEMREEIKRLKEEINDPEITSLTLEQLQELNCKLAEDVQVLAERFPRQSPIALREDSASKHTISGLKRQFSGGSDQSWEQVERKDADDMPTFLESEDSTPSPRPSSRKRFSKFPGADNLRKIKNGFKRQFSSKSGGSSDYS